MKSTSRIKKDAKPAAGKTAKKPKPYTMQIYESLEHIRKGKWSDMGLFELSIRALMPSEVFREIRKRLELARIFLKDGMPDNALIVVESLLASPQKNITAKGGAS